MSDDQPDVPVICPKCDTRTQVPLDDVSESVARHNDQLHDGEAVAEVDPAIREHLADRVAEDIGLLD
ncbi:hypothetical protein [Halostella salina]|uniref:hypothetical protein n=1 Tax=Halostella salina TaxID=1547897 RepID=UPI000EF81428|nr:hypothetical protein [Halostella salina]